MAVGVLALAAGIVVFLSNKNIADTYTGTATAILVDYEEEDDINSMTEVIETVYRPVVSYSVDGVEYTEGYSQTYSNPPYAIGDAVEIKYAPHAPQNFSIAEDDRGTVIALWEIPVGIILILLGVYQLKRIKKLQSQLAD